MGPKKIAGVEDDVTVCGESVPCPICGRHFPKEAIYEHANNCLDMGDDSGGGGGGGAVAQRKVHQPPPPPPPSGVQCPICSGQFSEADIAEHASTCQGVAPSGEPVFIPKEQPTFDCPLCKKKNVPLEACYRLDECSHPFCLQCVKNWATQKVVVSVTLGCPTCNAPFSVRDNKLLLDPTEGGTGETGLKKGQLPKHLRLDPRKRLMDELKHLKKTCEDGKMGFAVEPVDSDLFHWEAKLYGFDPKTDPIEGDLRKVKNGAITLDLKFPKDYPLTPPYVRVLRPRLQYMTGHVTIGGSICFEMLTNQGWEAQFTVESLLVAIRANLVVGNARVDFTNNTDYTEREAKDAFNRMMTTHGWN